MWQFALWYNKRPSFSAIEEFINRWPCPLQKKAFDLTLSNLMAKYNHKDFRWRIESGINDRYGIGLSGRVLSTQLESQVTIFNIVTGFSTPTLKNWYLMPNIPCPFHSSLDFLIILSRIYAHSIDRFDDAWKKQIQF